MKTSLNIEDSIFKAARREAERLGKTVSEVVSYWARVGRETLTKRGRQQLRKVPAVDLGGPASVNLNARRDWMESLES